MNTNAIAQRCATTTVATNARPTPRFVRTVPEGLTGRRQALGYLAGVLGGAALLRADRVEAVEQPFQESLFGGKPSQNASEQSMNSYDMEGIKKSGLSRNAKKGKLAKAKERAIASAGSE